jgi:hypothetical protein
MTNDKSKDPQPDEKQKRLLEDKTDQKTGNEVPGRWDVALFDAGVWGD